MSKAKEDILLDWLHKRRNHAGYRADMLSADTNILTLPYMDSMALVSFVGFIESIGGVNVNSLLSNFTYYATVRRIVKFCF